MATVKGNAFNDLLRPYLKAVWDEWVAAEWCEVCEHWHAPWSEHEYDDDSIN